jgi:STE24 endopeptidase
VAGWLADVATSQAIAAVFAAIGGALLVFALRRFGRRWWAPGAVAIVVFGVATTYGSPVVIEPLFNRFTPLPAGETRSDVLELARRARVDVGEVYVIDASKRTTGANAYVAGLGRTKRVVLYDTLLEDFPPAEVRLVVAHELGHVRYDDVPRGLLWLALVAPFGMLAAARLAEWLGPSDWRERPAAAVPAVALALAVIVLVITTISNGLSRDVEARADRYSLELTDDPRTLVAFQRRIALANVSDPEPPRLATLLLATHPPTLERIGAAVAYERGGGSAGGSGGAGRSNSGRFLIPSRVRHLE